MSEIKNKKKKILLENEQDGILTKFLSSYYWKLQNEIRNKMHTINREKEILNELESELKELEEERNILLKIIDILNISFK